MALLGCQPNTSGINEFISRISSLWVELFFGCEVIFLIKSFKVGRLTFNPDPLSWEDPPLIWTPLAGSQYRGQGRGKLLLSACWPSLVGRFNPTLVLEPTWGFWHILNSADIQLLGLSNYCILGLLSGDSYCWTSQTTACKLLWLYRFILSVLFP